MTKITVTAKKTLVCDFNIECFTKGKEYKTEYPSEKFTENSVLLNNQRKQHSPGGWFKHFKVT